MLRSRSVICCCSRRRATGAAAPRILVTLLLPVLAIQTLPSRSIAIPLGVDIDVSPNPLEGDRAVPEFENSLMVLLPFATHTWPFPSMGCLIRRRFLTRSRNINTDLPTCCSGCPRAVGDDGQDRSKSGGREKIGQGRK